MYESSLRHPVWVPEINVNPCNSAAIFDCVRCSLFFSSGGFFLYFCSTLLYTASYAAPQIPLCRKILEQDPGQFRLRHWLLLYLVSQAKKIVVLFHYQSPNIELLCTS